MQINKSKNSWHLCKPIEKCHTLFDGQALGFFAHFFYCSCGNEEAYTSNFQTTTYQCSECDNKDFLEKGILRESILYDVVDISYEYMKVDAGLKGIAYIDIPTDTIFLRKKILFGRYIIAELVMEYPSKKIVSPKSFDHTYIVKNLQRGLERYALDAYGNIEAPHSFKENALDASEKITLILFLLKYPKLKSIALYFWGMNKSLPKLYSPQKELTVVDALLYIMNGRKERSIRKAVFESHQKLEMEIQKIGEVGGFTIVDVNTFSPYSIFIICRCFEDPNIATMLIGTKTYFHPSDTYPIKLHDTIWLILFLKNHYSEINIANLLRTVDKNTGLWIDTVRMAATDRHAIRVEFKKVKLSVRRLHDAFRATIRGKQTKQDKAQKFTYIDVQKDACIQVENFEFKLPHTGKELYAWSEELDNCMFSYHPSITANETIIYGVFKNKQLLYAVEIFNDSINQASGKYNKEVLAEDNRMIVSWFERTFRGKKMFQEEI